MTWRRRRLGSIRHTTGSSHSSIRLRLVMLSIMTMLLMLAFFRPNESLQLLPYSLVEDLQQSNINPFGLMEAFSSSSSSASSASTNNDNKMNLLLYITTHFSDQHLRYFHCCWPKLVQESPLISSAHILVVASNHTTVDPEELDYLSSELFHQNPSYQIQFLSHYKNPCQKFRNEVPKGASNIQMYRDNPLKVPVNYKQCMANFGVQAGFEHGWVHHHANMGTPSSSPLSRRRTTTTRLYDWMIRINPDVLIRKSKWLLETMQASVDAVPSVSLQTSTFTDDDDNSRSSNATLAIGVYCATRQLHTDFFALRPHYWNSTAFSKMGRKGNKWNHERTGYKEIITKAPHNLIKYLPDVDPSLGSCRVRGENASVYHVHGSCQEHNMVCSALHGWDLRQ